MERSGQTWFITTVFHHARFILIAQSVRWACNSPRERLWPADDSPSAAAEWFKRDLSEFNFYLMPLSFVRLPARAEAVILNPEEKNFLAFIESLETKQDDPAGRYSVSVNIEIKFTRSKAKDALGVQVTNNPNAAEVRLTEEQVREKYPWDYDRLTAECRKRYTGFKSDQKYHDYRKKLAGDKRFSHVRELDPGNPKSAKKPFFNANILAEFDKIYTRS